MVVDLGVPSPILVESSKLIVHFAIVALSLYPSRDDSADEEDQVQREPQEHFYCRIPFLQE
jgi:hypothetical protein